MSSRKFHTIISCNLPFMIPILDGIYEVTIGKRSAFIFTKRIWRNQMTNQNGREQIMFDKYGISGYTHVDIRFPWEMPERDFGRRVTLFVEPYISPPRNRNKEIAINFLNRLIEVVRILYDQFHLRNVRYSDLLSWNQYYWDGNKRILVGSYLLDHGYGENNLTGRDMSKEKLQRMCSVLKKGTPIPLEQTFLANAKDSSIEEDFQIAILEGVNALEMVLYRFIRSRGKQLGILKKELDDSIVKVGQTGNVKKILKMLTNGFEQPDEKLVKWCSRGILIRNKILHEGLRDIDPSETEQIIQNVEKMIVYLTRWFIWLGIYEEI